MGAERRVVFDLVNVIQGTAKLSQALIRDKRVDTLFLLPASQTRDKDALTEEGVGEVIDKLRSVFDYVFCDSPAGIERGAQLAMRQDNSSRKARRMMAADALTIDDSMVLHPSAGGREMARGRRAIRRDRPPPASQTSRHGLPGLAGHRGSGA